MLEDTMHAAHSPRLRATRAVVAGVAGALALTTGCQGSSRPTSPDSPPNATVASGSQSTLLGRAAFESFHVKRKSGGWEMDVNAKDSLDVAVQSITFQPGS